MKDRDDDSSAGKVGASRTETAQGEILERVPRMPHEHDESADSQVPADSAAQALGRMAHDDVERGVPDTTRSVETDATYHRLREAPLQEAKADADPVGPRPAGRSQVKP